MVSRDDARTKKPATPSSERGRSASAAKRLATAGTALLATAALAALAQAAFTAAGPVLPATGFPAWYEDANGVQLELCIADPLCPSSPAAAEFVAPAGEAFWSVTSATVTGPERQSVTIAFDLKAAFLNDDPDSQISFGRVQVNMENMVGDGVYTVTHPYGSGTWTAEPDGSLNGGRAAAQRHEVGCPGPPCNFDEALSTEIGPFLTWDPAVAPAAPTGHIGDGLEPHAAVGSPLDQNFVRVEGPGLPAGGITTNEFTVEGRLASPPAPIFFTAPGSGAFGSQRVGRTVSRTVTIKNNGLADMQLRNITLSGGGAGAFTKGNDGCANQTIASGASCVIGLSFRPPVAVGQSASLVVVESGSPPHAIPLTGTGALPGVSASPEIMNFLDHRVTTTDHGQLLTVRNTGNGSLTISSAAISGPHAGEFAVTGSTCNTPVVDGDACTIRLKFLPAASGTRNAMLMLSSDALGRPHNVALTGTGTLVPG